jgi:hypothetical protein
MRGQRLRVRILYGERSDWVQNLLAGGGEVVRGGRTYPLVEPHVVAGPVLEAGLGEAESGFGRGPRAGA